MRRNKQYLKNYYQQHKEAMKRASKNYYDNNKEKALVVRKKWRDENREKHLNYARESSKRNAIRRKKLLHVLRLEKGGMCSMCGYNKEIDILHFHHLRDKKVGVTNPRCHSEEQMRKEADKCILLCPNCHAVVSFIKNHD